MRKKKRAFALLEVLIAIMLAAAASFFLLEFEGKLVSQNRKQLLNLQKEYYLQEATVRLYEALYTNAIAWKTVEDKGSYTIALGHPEWQAECLFTPIERKEPTPDHLVATVDISLMHAETKVNVSTFRIFATREERLHVETPAS